MYAPPGASISLETPAMLPQPPPYDPRALDAFVALVGARLWAQRIAQIGLQAASGPRAALLIRQRHALELSIDRLRGTLTRPPSTAELHAARLAVDAVVLSETLAGGGRNGLRRQLRDALGHDKNLVSLFHVLQTAALQASRGFAVTFAGLEYGAPYDLLIASGRQEAEIACDVVSAEEGRLVPRGAFSSLADRLDRHVRAWLAANPGSHLLKMTLPHGLNDAAVPAVQARICRMLAQHSRRDHDAAAVLHLDPFNPAGRPGEDASMAWLRREFGPEANLAVTSDNHGIFVMMARAGRTDEVGRVVRDRLFELLPSRLSGRRPGILAMFIDDTDRREWAILRETLALEGEARRFLAGKAARPVIAVTCSSRFELFGAADAAAEGEVRFRNPAHPAAKAVALAPAILSSV
ncbi:MAG TPA: hypothetical protein VFL55_03920 [Acetobacteraceae bacterium]|nr:hypothetical protein [Acetobacteraceae bacterium]